MRTYESLSNSNDCWMIETVTDTLFIDWAKNQNKKIVTLEDYFFGQIEGVVQKAKDVRCVTLYRAWLYTLLFSTWSTSRIDVEAN